MKKFSIILLLSCLSLIAATRNSYGAYCTPSWTDASGSCYTYGMDVSQFKIVGYSGTLNDVSACTGSGYENMTSTTLTCSMMQSVTYVATIACSGTYTMEAQVWIDFNNNTTFEASEQVGGANSYSYSGTSFNVNIPLTAAVGSHRMRVVATQFASIGTSMSSCAGYYYGDARDYNVTIVALPACSGAPTGGTAASTTLIACPSLSFTLSVTGGTVAAGMTYQWQDSNASTSGAWVNISGATNYIRTGTETATTYYRRNVTCTSSGSSATSAAVRVYYIGGCFFIPFFFFSKTSCTSFCMGN